MPDPFTDPVPDPFTDPVPDPITDPVTNTELVTDPFTEPVTQRVTGLNPPVPVNLPVPVNPVITSIRPTKIIRRGRGQFLPFPLGGSARAEPQLGGKFASDANYRVTSDIEVDLHTGYTKAKLINRSPVAFDYKSETPPQSRRLAGRNVDFVIDRSGTPIVSDTEHREYTRTPYGTKHKQRQEGEHGRQKGRGRSSRPRGGQEIKAARRGRR